MLDILNRQQLADDLQTADNKKNKIFHQLGGRLKIKICTKFCINVTEITVMAVALISKHFLLKEKRTTVKNVER